MATHPTCTSTGSRCDSIGGQLNGAVLETDNGEWRALCVVPQRLFCPLVMAFEEWNRPGYLHSFQRTTRPPDNSLLDARTVEQRPFSAVG